jgi:hypothetical protein
MTSKISTAFISDFQISKIAFPVGSQVLFISCSPGQSELVMHYVHDTNPGGWVQADIEVRVQGQLYEHLGTYLGMFIGGNGCAYFVFDVSNQLTKA